MLSNLLDNAVKYTPPGGRVTVSVSEDDAQIVVSVKDTGHGISSNDLPRIFERFYQVDSAVSRQYSGTGLGLSLCKAFTGLLGGKIWLNSEPGVGSTFYFTIPYIKNKRFCKDRRSS
jgi:signal transduction histidine kinase